MGSWMKVIWCTLVLPLLLPSEVIAGTLGGGAQAVHVQLPDFDRRERAVQISPPTREQNEALAKLLGRTPKAEVSFHPVTGAPRSIHARGGFLDVTNRQPQAGTVRIQTGHPDPYRVTKDFLKGHEELFGHGPDVLDRAQVKRELVAKSSGLRTIVWEQHVEGVPVFEALLISHTTRAGELVNLSSGFLPDPDRAAASATSNVATLLARPRFSARQAIARAAGNIGESLSEEDLQPVVPKSFASARDAQQRQRFKAASLKGNAEARLVWLPMSRDRLQLCWDVIIMSRTRDEMFRVLVDTQTGEPLLRRCLTESISPATYRVYTSDSPSPFSPGSSTPSSYQPPVVPRTLLTLSALDTNASPSGWINDGDNETLGNNVDAHTDHDGDDLPDLPRPQGSPFRVFDFPLDLTQAPATYSAAAVVQVFYWCNWMHDQLYDLGFTEAAGNFQNSNFGRGGEEGDAVQADAQDGKGFNNANFSTPPDGSPGRMQLYPFSFQTPNRDSDLDAEIVLHEYTHGLSNRRVGGGVGISALQTRGMGEGWSDFVALSLLSDPTDAPSGNYAFGAYVTYNLLGLFTQNYYFGIRRYPYATALNQNPLTFKDIDPQQASAHAGVPIAPYVLSTADEVHNMGEVWCVTLWQARANLIVKYGPAVGSQLMLQLVIDGMNLAPPNPTYLEARDAILQADLVDNGGANQGELWSAFAKRGMGVSADCPASSTTVGVFESFDLPDELKIYPTKPLFFAAQSGSPGDSISRAFLIVNTGSNAVAWAVSNASPWLSVNPNNGNLAAGSSNLLQVSLTRSASVLTGGTYSASLWFSNQVSGVTQQRGVILHQVPSSSAWTSLQTDPGWRREGQWAYGAPAGLGGAQNGSPDPTSAATGTNVLGVNLEGDYDSTPGGPYYLTAGPFNLSQCFSTKLAFQRWLNTDCQPYVDAMIDLSTDGTNWNRLWSNGNSEIADDRWLPMSFDISKYADNRSQVFIRWGYDINSSLANAYSGWNIDDIEIGGNPSAALALSLPATLAEGGGALTALVSVSSLLTNDLAVSLVCNNPAAVDLPGVVTIPAGQSNATFSVSATDNQQLDAARQVTVLATAPRCVPGAGSLLVNDNEAATLAVSLPSSAQEGQGAVSGSVQLGGLVTVDTEIDFTSSNPSEIAAPDPIIIPAGQGSGSFVVQVLDNGAIDGTQAVTITAHAAGWTNGSAVIAVVDNENINLTVSLPLAAWETDGVLPSAGVVSVSGTLTTNLVVSLTSDSPAHLQLPAGVTIIAGQTSQTFDLALVDDDLQTGDQQVSVTAEAAGFNAGHAGLVIRDAENPPAATNPTPADGQTNVDQGSGLAWQPGTLPRGTITNLVYFGTRPAPGDGELLGTTTNSTWSLPRLAPLTTYYWQVVAQDVGSTPGPVWQFTTRGVDHFVWDPVPSPEYINSAFGVTITALDAYGNIVSNFAGMLSLSGRSYSGPSVVISETFESGVLSNWLAGAAVTAYGITNDSAAGGTNSLVITGGGAPFAGLWQSLPDSTPDEVHFAVRAAATNIAGANFVLGDIPSGADMTSTNVVLAFSMRSDGTMGCDAGLAGSATVPYVADQWYHISLRLDWPARRAAVYVDGALAFPDVPFQSAAATRLAVVCLYNSEDTLSGWDEIELLGYSAGASVPVSPVQTGLFVDGRWQGELAIGTVASNVVLQAADDQGRSRLSSRFDVLLTNDIALSLQASPDPAAAGADLLYTLVVTNTGAADATDVLLVDYLPPGTTFISARATQGSCNETGGVVTCYLGQIPGGTNATIAIAILPGTAGLSITNYAQVTRAEMDGSADNNLAQLVTALAPPQISVLDQTMAQSVLTTTNMVFLVNLSAPSAQAVTVRYATSDATAVAGLDYLATNGLVTFPPGATSAPISVIITAGSSEQPDRDFLLALTDPTNATLAMGSATGHLTSPPAVPASIDHFAWSAIPALEITEIPFTVTIAAVDAAGALVTNFTGVAFLSASTPGSGFTTVPISPLISAPFNQGVWTGDLTVFSAASAVTLKADDSDGHIGLGNRFDVLPPGDAPAVVGSPSNLVVVLGDTATFSVEATGTPELVYQWSFNGTNLDGATNNTLLLTNVQPADAGLYAARVANAYGSDTSSNATLTVNEPAQIVEQPTNQATLPGGTASFAVVAVGTPELSYQWISNGTNLDGATNSWLSLTNVQPGDAGQYAVQVINQYGSDTSSNAMLVVNEPARITVQPSDQALLASGDGSFMVVAVGTPEFNYQWTFNGNNLPGATNDLLVLTNVQTAAAGLYAVTVANAFGSDTSSNAVLTVNVPAQILQPPTNVNVIAGAGTSFSVVATGTPELSYQWLFNGTNLVDATNSLLVITNVQLTDAGQYAVQVSNAFGGEVSSDAILALVEPAGIAEQPVDLTIMAGSNATFSIVPTGTLEFSYQWTLNGTNLPGATDNPLWLTNVQVGAAGVYAVEVSNAYGSQTSSNAQLIVNEAAHIVRQPANRRATVGSNTRFTVLAVGTAPLLYQWSFNGAILADATNSRLSLTNVQDAQAGLYAVLVSNVFGFELSSDASLTVVTPAQIAEQPTNQTVLTGDTASFAVVATGTPEISYQWFFNSTNLDGATNQVLVLTNVQPSAAGLYAVQVSNQFGFELSSNAELVVLVPAHIVEQPRDAMATIGGSATFLVIAGGTPELTYQWSFNGAPLAGATNSDLTLVDVHDDQVGIYSVSVSNEFGGDLSSNASLIIVTAAHIVEQPADQTVMTGNTVSFTVLAAGTPELNYQWLFNSTNLDGETNQVLTLTNVQPGAAGFYAVQVSNAFGLELSSSAVLVVNDPAHVLVQPVDVAAAVGGDVVFHVVAAGTPEIAYQWSFNGTLLADATNSWLSLTNVQTADTGPYAVLVSNTFGQALSSNALLTVGDPARVVESPSNLTVQAGESATFGVVAAGTPPLVYQWQVNGTNLAGATLSWLTLTNARLSDTGSYNVLVSNAFGFELSSNALLTVQPAPGPPPCAATVPGLVGWWAGESNVWDSAGGNQGTLFPGTDYATGRVGVAFSFQTASAGVDLGDPESLKLTNSLSLEAWLWLDALPTPEQGEAQILFRGNPWPCQVAYSLSVQPTARVRFHVGDESGATLCGVDLDTLPISTQQWIHVAAVLDGAAAKLQVYFNGELAAETNAAVQLPRELPGGGVVVGNSSPGSIPQPLEGLIDELAVYDRPLLAAEVKAIFDAGESGKCPLPAAILASPASQIVPRGSNVTFSVSAAGSWPVSYQWRKQGTNLVDGTRISGVTLDRLVIPNAQLSDRGDYSVLVSNQVGSAESAPVSLFVYALDHFTWDPIASPKLTNRLFTVTLQARDPNDEVVTNFDGRVGLTSTNGVPIHPGLSGSFVLGAWTGSIWVGQPASNLVLLADDGLGHAGTASPINIISRPRVKVLKTGNSILVTWPVEASGLVLETCTDLFTQNWTPFTGQISAIGDGLGIRLGLSSTNGFYRLRFTGE